MLVTMPARAEHSPLNAYADTLVRDTGSPINVADCSLFPIAYSVRPKRVNANTNNATTSMSGPTSVGTYTYVPLGNGTAVSARSLYAGSVIVTDVRLIK